MADDRPPKPAPVAGMTWVWDDEFQQWQLRATPEEGAPPIVDIPSDKPPKPPDQPGMIWIWNDEFQQWTLQSEDQPLPPDPEGEQSNRPPKPAPIAGMTWVWDDETQQWASRSTEELDAPPGGDESPSEEEEAPPIEPPPPSPADLAVDVATGETPEYDEAQEGIDEGIEDLETLQGDITDTDAAQADAPDVTMAEAPTAPTIDTPEGPADAAIADVDPVKDVTIGTVEKPEDTVLGEVDELAPTIVGDVAGPAATTIGEVEGPAPTILGGVAGAQEAQVAASDYEQKQADFIESLTAIAGGDQSIVDEQMKKAMDRAMQANRSMMASARGGNIGLQARQAAGQTAMTQQELARDAMIASLEERRQARQQLGEALSTGRGQDIEVGIANVDASTKTRLTNYQGELDLAVEQGRITSSEALTQYKGELDRAIAQGEITSSEGLTFYRGELERALTQGKISSEEAITTYRGELDLAVEQGRINSEEKMTHYKGLLQRALVQGQIDSDAALTQYKGEMDKAVAQGQIDSNAALAEYKGLIDIAVNQGKIDASMAEAIYEGQVRQYNLQAELGTEVAIANMEEANNILVSKWDAIQDSINAQIAAGVTGAELEAAKKQTIIDALETAGLQGLAERDQDMKLLISLMQGDVAKDSAMFGAASSIIAGLISTGSDVRMKKNFGPPDRQLDELREALLGASEWEYSDKQAGPEGVRFIGPMANDLPESMTSTNDSTGMLGVDIPRFSLGVGVLAGRNAADIEMIKRALAEEED